MAFIPRGSLSQNPMLLKFFVLLEDCDNMGGRFQMGTSLRCVDVMETSLGVQAVWLEDWLGNKLLLNYNDFKEKCAER